ncbi:OmpA family protein [Algoriphagus antarcticus]|uniref:Outer membrane protein OmpA-like peptidoglycan-associated protein n=1 Tax=Algoriphagus antarcticus TaxID=238540 RepID=A0A3E0EAH8_9BACT|nr:OmpA family protein [Algoriphagus antarcticus]REG94259.1 outer membrane protein OmpA-like peptidoglycan-associated protein [Algoriphagus antarcticus]
MRKFNNVLHRASGVMLLAFCFSFNLQAQKVVSLSGANSPQDDMNPVWIGDNTLLFTRAFHPDNIGGVSDPGDIWMTKKDDSGKWQEAVHRADLSTDGYDFSLGLEDYLTLLMYHTGGERFGIYQYSKFGTDWNFLRQVSMAGLDGLSGQVAGRVASGGKVIFLSGKGKDSKGNEDIYVSEKVGPIDWSKPVNIGSAVNTMGQEMSPFYDANSGELYFSSNMHEGAEGKDIFIAKRMGDGWNNWSKPVIWKQVSSPGSEVSVTFINEEEVVWTSTQNSDGFADLLTFETVVPLVIPDEFVAAEPEPMTPNNVNAKTVAIVPIFPASTVGFPEVKVTEEVDEKAESPISWFVVDAKNKTLISFSLGWKAGDNLVSKSATDSVILSELENSQVREIKVNAEGYFPKSILLSEIKTGEPTVVLMTKAESGSIILLDNVNFKRATAELEGEDTKASLVELAEFLLKNPAMTLRIHGHTDSAGDPSLNKALSLDRAGSVRDFLIEQGVPFESLRISGWGGTRPSASNATEAGRSKNRRVELEVER